MPWSKQLEQLEAELQYDEIIRILRVPVGPLDSRCKAALARAYSFRNQLDQARQLLAELSSTETEESVPIVTALTQARLARIHGDWNQSLVFSEEAYALAKKCPHHHLRLDALFSLGVSFVELERLFMGLDCFRRVCSDPDVSIARRDLALANEAWVLWDLGRPEQLRQVSEALSAGEKHRVHLFLDLLQGDLARCWHYARNGLGSDFQTGDSFFIVHLFIRAATVFRDFDLIHQMRDGWIGKFLLEKLNSETIPHRVQFCSRSLALLDFPVDLPKLDLQQATWRDAMELRQTEAILVSRTDPQRGREIYLKELNPILEAHLIRTPLVPPLLDAVDFTEVSPWAKALFLHLGMKSEKTPHALLKNGVLSWVRSDGTRRKVDLSKHPTSRRLLEVLAGPKGKVITKEAIHLQLTKTKYVARLHDGRLLKLLSRLKTLLRSKNIPQLWSLPGDHTVVIQYSIQTIELNQ